MKITTSAANGWTYVPWQWNKSRVMTSTRVR